MKGKVKLIATTEVEAEIDIAKCLDIKPWMNRVERVEKLERFYLQYLLEDTINGSNFDVDVLTSLALLKSKHSNAPQPA